MKTTSYMVAVMALAALTQAACTQQDDCAAVGDVEFVCGPINAEDLVLVPDTPWIIASGMAAGAGFSVINTDTDAAMSLPVSAGAASSMYPQSCAEPPEADDFESHGLDLHVADNGNLTLHAVGHGPREAIEIYDVDMTSDSPSLVWKGCVPMPDGLAANSVTSFDDGSLAATVLFLPGRTFADAVVDKEPTGAVFRWRPGDSGFTRIEGSDLPANNGITRSADGREIYVASSGLQTIVAFSDTNPTRQLGTSAPLPITPDNVHLAQNGMLLTAGMKNDVPECGGPPGSGDSIERLAACPRGSIAIEIDPTTMADRVLVETPALEEFSNATMVLPAAGHYWFGTFMGDRVASVAMP